MLAKGKDTSPTHLRVLFYILADVWSMRWGWGIHRLIMHYSPLPVSIEVKGKTLIDPTGTHAILSHSIALIF